MTHADANHDDSLDLAAIEPIRQRYTAAWQQGERPNLLEYLQPLAGASRRHALCELLWIEWEHLRRLGTPPQLADYQVRFAEFMDVVDEAWRSDFGRFSSDANTTQILGGRYTDLKPHARGGIGQVYVATDAELGRQVALKAIQARHAHSLNIQERFVREAKITGKLEHPGIVPVYSMGTKPDGSPYYATRFIHGESLQAAIEEFRHRAEQPVRASASGAECESPPASERSQRSSAGSESVVDNRNAAAHQGPLKVRARGSIRRDAFDSREFRQLLARFVDVCHVIEYAHSRGVLHRDLKPANIMLGKYGETLVVDWGLAKEANEPEPTVSFEGQVSSLTSMTFTTHGALIGTVSYMSPEQAAGKLGELTAASDLYSLGATLYHILVGHAPLSEEPQDTRLTRIQRGDVPRAQAVEPAVPKPLDAICANAMSQDPADRYRSPTQLADDLKHWLADEPVSAYTEPAADRVARWARRHQTAMISGVIGTSLVAAASVMIAILVIVNNRHLDAARTEAVNKSIAATTAQANAEKAQSEAETERDAATSSADFLFRCFRRPDPAVLGTNMTVIEFLEQSFIDLKATSKIPPKTKSQLFEALTASFNSLGHFHQGNEIAEYALEYAKTRIGNDQETILKIEDALAQSMLGVGKTEEAISRFESIVDKTRRLFGPDHVITIESELHQASAYYRAKNHEKALASCKTTIEKTRRICGATHSLTVGAEFLLATILIDQDQINEAIELFKKLHAYQTRETRDFGLDQVNTLHLLNGLATAYAKSGRHEEAIDIHTRVLKIRRERYGVEHPYTLNTQNNLANAYQAAGNLESALQLHSHTYEIRKKLLGDKNIETLTSANNLATVYAGFGRTDEAIDLLERTWQYRKELLGEDNLDTLRVSGNLAAQLMRAGYVQKAIPLFEQQVTKTESQLGELHPDVLMNKCTLALAYRQVGQSKLAITIYRELLPSTVGVFGAEHPQTLRLQVNLATALVNERLVDEAVPLYEKTLKQQTMHLGLQHPETLQTQVNLATCLLNIERPMEAMPLFESAKQITIDKLGWAHPVTFQLHIGLATAYGRDGFNEKSIETYEALIEQLEVYLGPTHSYTVSAQRSLAGRHFVNGNTTEAILVLERAVVTLRNSLGNDNAQTADAIFDLATSLRCAGRFKEAEPLYRELTGMENNRRGNTTAQAEHFYWLGMCQLKEGKPSDAELSLRECVELRRQLMPSNWNAAVAKCMLGVSLAHQEKFVEAEDHLLAGFEAVQMLRDTIPDDEQRMVSEIGDHISQLYEVWGKPQLVELWRKRVHD